MIAPRCARTFLARGGARALANSCISGSSVGAPPLLFGRSNLAVSLPSSAAPVVRPWGMRSFSNSVKVTFVDRDGDSETVDAAIGENFLDIAHDNDIEVEGACGGEMACSTCHMIFDEETYGSLPAAEEEEEDMLDLALGLTDTSRLGCQVICTKEMDGITIRLPSEVSNMQG